MAHTEEVERGEQVRIDSTVTDAPIHAPSDRVLLARTGMWIQSLGRTDTVGAGLNDDWAAPLLVQTDSPFGRVEHLAPVLKLSKTPARWDRPTVPLGTHSPDWDARGS